MQHQAKSDQLLQEVCMSGTLTYARYFGNVLLQSDR